MAARVSGGRAGTMPGPRLAYVALVTTVFGPFWSFNTKTFQNLVSDRRSSYVWRYVGAQRPGERRLETLGPANRDHEGSYCVGRSAHKLANFLWSWGKNDHIFTNHANFDIATSDASTRGMIRRTYHLIGVPFQL